METGQSRALRELASYYGRNGYVRRQDANRFAKEGSRQYKKGDEVRLVACTMEELRLVRRLLRQAGFKPGRPFRKGRQYRQPVYGRLAVARFLEAVESEGDA
jgi:hypothetical protein